MTAHPPAGKLPSILSIPLHPCDCGDAEECDCPIQPPAGGMTIVIPGTPDKRLSVNAARRTHYMQKARISADARYDAAWCTKQAFPVSYLGPMFSGPVRVSQCVYWGKGERSVDLDSIPPMLKPVLDGITDAGVVWNDDAQITELTVSQARAADGLGYVEITVCAAER